MSHLKYYNYAGTGENLSQTYWYNQAVRNGNRIELSGQTGLHHETGDVSPDIGEQIKQAFHSIDIQLKDAGGKGWSQVYKIRSYHVGIDEVHAREMTKNLKERFPEGHKPLWTFLGVAGLASPDLRVEIDVEAIDE
ncbi:MAG: hypothetical protein Q9209_003487 [Squamulea sp. 1 TL-2023]